MKIILFFLALSTICIFPSGKHYIYFKDKGIKEGEILNKGSRAYSSAIQYLSEKAITRRKKVLGNDFIQYTDIPVNSTYIEEITHLGIKIENVLKWFNAVTAYLDSNQVRSLNQLPFIKEIVPVKTLKYIREEIKYEELIRKSADFNYGNSFNQLALSQIPEVHGKGITGEGVLIGFMDTGFDWKRHTALNNARVVREYDFVKRDSVTANQPGDHPDQDEHGTCTFSTVAGYKDSLLIGVSFNSSFLLAKTEDVASETHIEEDNYAAALEWMENLGVDITTSSLGYNIFDIGNSYSYKDMNGNTTVVTRAAKHAFALGVVTITSAGNEACDNPGNCWYYITAPGDENNIITVGAVNIKNEVTSYSSRGPTSDGRIKPDVVALGNSVFCALAGTTDRYIYETGTSLSAPLVSGIVGLLLSSFPHLNNRQVRSIIQMSGDNFSNPNNLRGYGLLSARNALNMPNIRYDTSYGGYLVNKFFFPDKVNSSSVMMTVISSKDTVTQLMNQIKDFRFSAPLPKFSMNEKVWLYFRYSDSTGIDFREPYEPGNSYTYFYSSEIIHSPGSNLLPPADYGILSNNYPNPFNNQTQIQFRASAGDKAEILIFNSLGERVKRIYIANSINGYNTIAWDGRNDERVSLSSGVYIYQLNLNGSYYTKKMTLLK